MSPWESANVELDSLIGLFYDDPSALGDFVEIDPDRMPEPARSLLNHDHHMTVTVEKYHSSPVTVEVVRQRCDGDSYSREILLRRATDGQVVQYGIVRLDLTCLAPAVRDEILRHEKPLGRVLIDHDVLRQVKSKSMYQVAAGPALSQLLQVAPGSTLYGRTAIIFTDLNPAIELLEIVC